MQLGMIGLGRMGANIVRRLMRQGHECVVYDRNSAFVDELSKEGATGCGDLDELVSALSSPRVIWIMVPAGIAGAVVDELSQVLDGGDIIIDGGNSYYKDDIDRAGKLASKNIHYVDIGTSGGVWGLERGYCLMIGGESDIVEHLDPLLRCIAPGESGIDRTPGRTGNFSPSELGYLHCGSHGAGHFVKMVHNGIEYGIMAAYAEGLNILKHANIGAMKHDDDAETTPLRHPEHYQYDIDTAEVAEVWRRGSVIASWLLDLTATALKENPGLENFSGKVSDSGEGRWTSMAAIESGTSAHVLTAALFNRFTSRGETDYADKLLSAMRNQFGGHIEKK